MEKPEVRKSNVTVRWENPFDGECNVSRFTVYYRETMERQSLNWKKVIVSRDDFQTTLQLNCTTVYEIAVTAWSSHGETLRDGNIKNTQTFGGTLIPDRFRSTCFSFFGPLKANERPSVAIIKSLISTAVCSMQRFAHDQLELTGVYETGKV